MKKNITAQRFGEERALYAISDTEIFGCAFEGDDDGESALKECSSIKAHNCKFALRYPLWHCKDFAISDCSLTEGCRAPMWYGELGTVRHCRIDGIKALRECTDTLIEGSVINSNEFGWKCKKVNMRKTHVTSEYLFLGSSDLELSNITMSGKYSFQYVQNAVINDSVLNTKDAFWHAKNVTAINCEINGEYLGWYSENLTLIDCKISGTQPLCYCKGLKLVNCTMNGCDLSFEYSDVEADISGNIDSVKNPRSGYIKADTIGEIINDGSVMDTNCKIELR